MQYHRKIRHAFLNSGDQTCPSILEKIHFKGVVLELLDPICKREKSGLHSRGFFPLETSLPALDGGVGSLFTEAFLPWLNLVCPSPTEVPFSSLLVLPPRWREDAPGVDLMTSQTDVQLLTIKTFVWFSLLL